MSDAKNTIQPQPRMETRLLADTLLNSETVPEVLTYSLFDFTDCPISYCLSCRSSFFVTRWMFLQIWLQKSAPGAMDWSHSHCLSDCDIILCVFYAVFNT